MTPIESSLATHAIEALTPSEDALRLCREMEERNMSADAAVQAVLKKCLIDERKK